MYGGFAITVKDCDNIVLKSNILYQSSHDIVWCLSYNSHDALQGDFPQAFQNQMRGKVLD